MLNLILLLEPMSSGKLVSKSVSIDQPFRNTQAWVSLEGSSAKGSYVWINFRRNFLAPISLNLPDGRFYFFLFVTSC